ncbi:aminoglycoside 6-adenylyltransferase [Helicobacter muridarum]|uniref:Aminoglycoside 6-adenylyltransferase n=1 Tax=Helicobacter muridarum TaxID=216 RepID=A0A377PT58_9HELI|nr:aminoglycoside 6-adenylyltransferase [Helicobacter muridarum]STQ85797.1 Aminoglycoside 6-adenylyltransferase [Helicobacter muridarum]
MRKEQEIISLILHFASKIDSIRAVTLEGSRVNPNIKQDIFCDYDISFFLDRQSIYDFQNSNDEWLKVFGNLVMLQKPESMELYPPDLNGWFSYLMLFDDGVRIDLKLIPVEDMPFYKDSEKLMRVLLDKDNFFSPLNDPSDSAFFIKPLTKQSFLDCCNDFYWLYVCVSKDILRCEVLLANAHLNMMREGIFILLSWHIALKQRNFEFSLGKEYKFLPHFLSKAQTKKLYSCFNLGNKKQAKKTLKVLEKFFAQNARGIIDLYFRNTFCSLPYRKEALSYVKILKNM